MFIYNLNNVWITNFLDIIHRLSLIEKYTRRFEDWSLSPSSSKKGHLPDDGDKLQSPKRRVCFLIKVRR
jgi:hypothetical protein